MSIKVKLPQTDYDVSTPVNVVASAYDTSGNGGRKLVRLSNGWVVVVVANGTTDYRLYGNKLDGNGWVLIGTLTAGGYNNGVAITSVGTTVHLIRCGLTGVSSAKWDVASISWGGALSYSATVDTGQTAMGACSITAHTDGTLHAAWSSKNSARPNSFNIRYSKSTDGGVTWATPTQVTTLNVAGYNDITPCIVVKSDGNPILFGVYSSTTNTTIFCSRWTGSAWQGALPDGNVYSGGTYTQSNPCATVAPDGTIHVVWQGRDSTDTAVDNIRYSKSIDGGATWSAASKLTSGNSYSQDNPSIACNSYGNVFIRFVGRTSGTVDFIRGITYSSGAWGAVSNVITGTATQNYPQLCDNHKNFTDPLMIWQDNQSPSVKFRGVWQTGGWVDGVPYVRVLGVWKTVSAVSVKVSGAWKNA